MIPFSSTESLSLIKDSIIRPDIIESFTYQRTNCRCGLAVLETILFAANKIEFSDDKLRLGVLEPLLIMEPLKSGRSIDDIDSKTESYGGMSLDEVEEIGLRFFKKSKKYYSLDSELQILKNLVHKSLISKEYLIIQFLASELGLKLNGHFVVIGGYNQSNDLLLMIDPARHRHKWYWEDIAKVFNASSTVMNSTGCKRGFVSFSD